MPGQWEYQVGPTEGINMGDDLWVSRSVQDTLPASHGLYITAELDRYVL